MRATSKALFAALPAMVLSGCAPSENEVRLYFKELEGANESLCVEDPQYAGMNRLVGIEAPNSFDPVSGLLCIALPDDADTQIFEVATNGDATHALVKKESGVLFKKTKTSFQRIPPKRGT